MTAMEERLRATEAKDDGRNAGQDQGRERRALEQVRFAHGETLTALASSLELREPYTAGRASREDRVSDPRSLRGEAIVCERSRQEDAMKSEVSEAQVQRRLRCRVCLKTVGADEDHLTAHYRGTNYIVCCPSCASKFQAAPLEYVGEP
jgi:YHS domain-containing protein